MARGFIPAGARSGPSKLGDWQICQVCRGSLHSPAGINPLATLKCSVDIGVEVNRFSWLPLGLVAESHVSGFSDKKSSLFGRIPV